MLKFISIGSGSSGNCYYLYTDNDGLLIDIGIGVRTLKKHFRNYGLSLRHVRHILITHDHADHVKSVGSLSRELDIPVYATASVHVGIDHNYCVKNKVESAHRRIIEKNEPISIGDFEVTPFEVPHDSRDCVGYRIVYKGVVFCLITDVGFITEDIGRMISGADYLVLEANHDDEMLKNGPYPQYLKNRILSNSGHLSNEKCGLALAEHATPRLKHVWLCHLSEENNHPELARKTVENVLQAHGIAPGTDFVVEVLKRKLPSGVCDLQVEESAG